MHSNGFLSLTHSTAKPLLPLHARIGSIQVQSKADIFRVPPGHKATWIRIADPHRAEIHLRDESRQAIAWLSACFSRDRVRRSIRQKPALQCYAAADAIAKGETFGVGGWLVTSSQCTWFSAAILHVRGARTVAAASGHCAALHCMFWNPGTACPRYDGASHLFGQAMVVYSPICFRQRTDGLDLTNSGAQQSHWAHSSSWQQLGQRGVASSSWSPTSRVKRILGRMPSLAIACAHSRTACRTGIALPWQILKTLWVASHCARHPQHGRTRYLKHSIRTLEKRVPPLARTAVTGLVQAS